MWLSVELGFCNILSGKRFGWFRLLNVEFRKQLKRVTLEVSELDEESTKCTIDGMEALEMILLI